MKRPWRTARIVDLAWRASLAASALGTTLLCSACGAKKAGMGGFAVPVDVQAVRSARVSESSEYVATLKSRKSITLQPQAEGRIASISVRSGDQVAAGDPILQIDPAKQKAAVRSLEASRAAKLAALHYAQDQQKRMATLYEGGAASQQELDQARTSLESARADLDALDEQIRQQQVELQYYDVRAPAAGIVGDVPVRVGDYVTTSTRLTTIDQYGNLEVYVAIPAEKASRLRMGLPLDILDGEGRALAQTKISFISPQVDDATQSVLIKGEVPNARREFREAQLVRARVVWSTHEGPVVPTTAVIDQNGQRFAFVTETQEGKVVARQRPVAVGEIIGNDYVVLKGLSDGEHVIVSGVQKLSDGTPVRPQS
jgi:RND family efflux transporter MFP subunit